MINESVFEFRNKRDFDKYFGFLKTTKAKKDSKSRVRRNKNEKEYVERLRRGF